MRASKIIHGIEYGFFICPPMTLGDIKYYGLIYDFASHRDLKSSGAFSSAEEVESWLEDECKKLEE